MNLYFWQLIVSFLMHVFIFLILNNIGIAQVLYVDFYM